MQRARKIKIEHKSSNNNKANALVAPGNKIEFNFGILKDFLNYSGMSVQDFHKTADFKKPLCP